MKASKLASMAEEVVAAALRRLPADIREAARSVPVHLQPRPEPELLEEGMEPDLLGLFCGNPLGTELSQDAVEPPQILLFTANLWDYAGEDPAAYREEVRITFLHELGHYLGWDEDQLAQRGLD